MVKFNLKMYNKENYVMQCQTEEEAKSFHKYLSKLGLKWCDNAEYTPQNTKWDVYRENTCYNFHKGHFCDVNFYERKNYNILRYCDFTNFE